MKKVLLFCCLLFSLSANTQITITIDDMPNAGDSLRYSTAPLDSISNRLYRESGTDYNWDFSHLQATNQRVSEYERAFQTPYALFFLGFDKYGTEIIDTLGFGQFALTDVYDFYQRKQSAFEAEGRGFRVNNIPIPTFFTDDDEIYQFPLQYGDIDSSTFAFEAEFQELVSYRSEGYRVNNVDAWGTVKTPYGSFQCIRVITDVVALDTVRVQDFEVGFRNTRREYKWLAKGEAFPIVEITGLLNTDDNSFTPTNLRYRDDYRVIESPLAPVADFEATNTNPRAFQDTVQLQALTQNLPTNEYRWRITPNTFEFVNDSDENTRNPSIVFTETGVYDVSLNVQNNSGADELLKEAYIIVGTSSTADLEVLHELKLFPNPISDGRFELQYNLAEPAMIYVELYDLAGRKIQTLLRAQALAGQQRQAFFVEDLKSGVYLLNVQIDDKQQILPIAFLQ